ncbi:2-succinyl-5-enolpyruvyl-6-hydroxy-3-cyclohexene-1-carboxylic-acid synthase [Fulvivirga sedimenti]|uniref:2-succinyl-5-enolpyruvyl-6-hydroxy-3-cyclohexene-1-carboxylate synthase n=1 Tax=Fulvivirga sedimenti TaxID=2879465 RepID=A0A9X1HJK3_9BACT|nr:2-succinyl-5-enolpyruvyl-6-hydroxy-3-cyclohexene-1-carboxylic-acid synthase [Fulvivirga sedimenti]MCA6073303.1 2-succinyl-5-enolpyruvyl-6-hydroxy-3-cyclohexene-1-carboxylic-acid synthase [Fulvivirga sedimenti]
MDGNFNKNEHLAGRNSLRLDLQPIYNLAEICHKSGITHAILSPGSRCAPLVLAFSRHPGIQCLSIPDERSAAFIALGIAQHIKKPVVLICTSGSAAYNYAPAIAEAYFRQVPLLVLTADRPPEWVGQLDGQTIWQDQLYGKHVRFSASAPVDLTHQDARWHLYRIMNEAIRIAQGEPGGPSHLNIPFREPFYPESDSDTFFESDVPYHSVSPSKSRLEDNTRSMLQEKWSQASRKMILTGQSAPDDTLTAILKRASSEHHIPVAGDIISNIHPIPGAITRADVFLNREHPDLDNFHPDLLVTFGLSLLSKNLKNFFRERPAAEHWHIQAEGEVADPLKSITRIIRCEPEDFLSEMLDTESPGNFERQKQENFFQIWNIENGNSANKLESFFASGDHFGEFEVVFETLKHLPGNSNLHLANSMAVRYANYCGLNDHPSGVVVYSNRGACGIDGCTSTAVGSAIADPSRLNILITGDVGFFYDRNAFWHKYTLPNLRVVLLNNHGGGIFRMIQGPSQLAELEDFFETEQRLNAKNLCDEFGFEHLRCDKRSKLKHFIEELMIPDSRTKILEVETESEQNKNILVDFKKLFR